MLLENDSNNQVKPHATEGGRAERLCAMEDALQGKIVSQLYASADIVTCGLPAVGTVMNMLIKDGETITIGEELVSGGDGTLKAADNLASSGLLLPVIARAVEAISPSGAHALAAVRFV
jgi:hypothetical protein